MAGLYVGTSGYAYAEWKGSFYPAKLPAAKMLSYYAQQFGTVEINYTFYRLPAERTLLEWMAATPDGFQFALKANQRITHVQRLENVEALLRRFLEAATVLALEKRLGPLLFQLPPNFACDLERLDEFLQQRPRAARFAVEFRDPSWFTEEVFETLRRHQTALCLAETDDTSAPEVLTADFVYLRLRRSEYSDAELRAWRKKLDAWRGAGSDVYAYFKHEEAGRGPDSARRLLAL
ncbi:MAG: DUF72 domain-containing protein [Acidobacteria bacterium]|nr:DUF72 domain-containing protein [Acidobacteriota bacterium]